MTLYVEDDHGACVCADCGYGACITSGLVCIAAHCQCGCRTIPRGELDSLDAERARELDDRPDETLAAIARDMEAEARPDVAALLAERYGRPTRGAA